MGGCGWCFVTRRYEKTGVGEVLFSVQITQHLHFLNFALFGDVLGYFSLIVFIN